MFEIIIFVIVSVVTQRGVVFSIGDTLTRCADDHFLFVTAKFDSCHCKNDFFRQFVLPRYHSRGCYYLREIGNSTEKFRVDIFEENCQKDSLIRSVELNFLECRKISSGTNNYRYSELDEDLETTDYILSQKFKNKKKSILFRYFSNPECEGTILSSVFFQQSKDLEKMIESKGYQNFLRNYGSRRYCQENSPRNESSLITSSSLISSNSIGTQYHRRISDVIFLVIFGVHLIVFVVVFPISLVLAAYPAIELTHNTYKTVIYHRGCVYFFLNFIVMVIFWIITIPLAILLASMFSIVIVEGLCVCALFYLIIILICFVAQSIQMFFKRIISEMRETSRERRNYRIERPTISSDDEQMFINDQDDDTSLDALLYELDTDLTDDFFDNLVEITEIDTDYYSTTSESSSSTSLTSSTSSSQEEEESEGENDDDDDDDEKSRPNWVSLSAVDGFKFSRQVLDVEHSYDNREIIITLDDVSGYRNYRFTPSKFHIIKKRRRSSSRKLEVFEVKNLCEFRKQVRVYKFLKLVAFDRSIHHYILFFYEEDYNHYNYEWRSRLRYHVIELSKDYSFVRTIGRTGSLEHFPNRNDLQIRVIKLETRASVFIILSSKKRNVLQIFRVDNISSLYGREKQVLFHSQKISHSFNKTYDALFPSTDPQHVLIVSSFSSSRQFLNRRGWLDNNSRRIPTAYNEVVKISSSNIETKIKCIYRQEHEEEQLKYNSSFHSRVWNIQFARLYRNSDGDERILIINQGGSYIILNLDGDVLGFFRNGLNCSFQDIYGQTSNVKMSKSINGRNSFLIENFTGNKLNLSLMEVVSEKQGIREVFQCENYKGVYSLTSESVFEGMIVLFSRENEERANRRKKKNVLFLEVGGVSFRSMETIMFVDSDKREREMYVQEFGNEKDDWVVISFGDNVSSLENEEICVPKMLLLM